MLSTADVSVQEVLRYFTRQGLDVGLLVPTETGMGKSIMDATGNVRDFLRNSGLHDYDQQVQGTEHKKTIPTRLVTSTGIVGTQTSLYRPVTKDGDPRIWIYGLKQYAEPGNVLVLVAVGSDELLVINASSAGLVPGVLTPASDKIQVRDGEGVDLDSLLAPLVVRSNEVAIELLGLLRDIAGKWHKGIAGVRRDTEVGRLLEELLGIRANSSRAPDYKGIEIKAGRKGSTTRQTLFAKVPEWSLSRLKSSAEVLDVFGYQRGDKYSKLLQCTTSAKAPNPQGLYLTVPSGQTMLVEASKKEGFPDVVTWRMEDLKQALQQKHPETFWVTASAKRGDGFEEFRYEHVLHTRKPMANSLPTLLETGVVTLDHLITRDLTGKVKEKGPLFKIWKKDMDLLFPPGDFYSL